MRTLRPLLIVLIGLLVSCGIEDQGSPTYADADDQLVAEYGGTIVNQEAVKNVLGMSKEITLQWRTAGIDSMIQATKTVLSQNGATASELAVLDGITDHDIGRLLPGLDWTEASDEQIAELGSKASALGDKNPNKEYWSCPPISSTGAASCVVLIDAAKNIAMKSIDSAAIAKMAEELVATDEILQGEDESFKDYAKTYLQDLALQIHKFGIEVAAVQAEWTLRQAGVCDDKVLDGKEIARLRGVEESTTLLRKLVTGNGLTLQPQGSDCLKIGAYGSTADSQIKNAIKAHIDNMKKTDPFCPDYSLNNPALTEAYKAFEEGLQRGVNAQLTTVWIATFRNGRPWSQGGKIVVAKIDGCNAKDQITYTTSPLVIDLEGNGLELSMSRVNFDLRATGEPQKTTWTREGFLALDLNGDGRVNSGYELFGDRTLCGTARCADGAVALSAHDQNNDGRIDSRDAVFGALGIWVDANQDGRTQAGELQSLSAHGIKAFTLAPSYMSREVPGGKIGLTLGVETSKGSTTAYDVWFHNQTAPGFSTALF